MRKFAKFTYITKNAAIKKPCGEPQGWDEKLYILKDYSVTPGIAFQASTVSATLRSSTI